MKENFSYATCSLKNQKSREIADVATSHKNTRTTWREVKEWFEKGAILLTRTKFVLLPGQNRLYCESCAVYTFKSWATFSIVVGLSALSAQRYFETIQVGPSRICSASANGECDRKTIELINRVVVQGESSCDDLQLVVGR